MDQYEPWIKPPTIMKFDIVTRTAIGITTTWITAFYLLQSSKCGKHVNTAWVIDSTRCLHSYKYTIFISDLLTGLLVYCLPIPNVSSSPFSEYMVLISQMIYRFHSFI